MPIPVQRISPQLANDSDFRSVLREAGLSAAANDEILAEVIDADGRLRLQQGLDVKLERYLGTIPDLEDRPDALDAALEAALRSMSGSSRISPKAVEALNQQFPRLASAIREAATLNAALLSTSSLRSRVAPRPAKSLPCDFGPAMADGRRRYRLQKLLGQGSFGQVYRAEDRQLSEEGHSAEVAIKVLSAAERTDHDRHRMIDEATKARRISHPNVVQVIDRGVSDEDEDFIVYEFVEGGDLSDLADAALPLAPRRAVEIVTLMARGVHAAHAAGLIHCDLKPSNVMMTGAGTPKVADFGIAVRVGDDHRAYGGDDRHAGMLIGNIAFVSPEQYRGEPSALSVPSDVYALGGILYHLLTGRLPNGSSPQQVAATHDRINGRNQAPSPRQDGAVIDRDLDAICRRALAPDPAQRHASAAALAEDLERWSRYEPIAWTHPSPVRRLALWSRRKPALAAASLAIVALAVGGVAAASHFAREADRRAMEATIAQMKVDREVEIKQIQQQFGAKVVSGLRTIGDRQQFLTDVLMQVWVYEYLYGPLALGMPEHVGELWAARISALRQVVEQRRASGLGDTLETLLWENALAFWLISDHEHAEALPLLDANLERWRNRLDADDPWLEDMATLRLCGEVNRACDQRAVPGAQPASHETLASLEASLTTATTRVASSHPRSPLHYLALNRLADLNDPGALDQPQRAAEYRAQVKTLLKETQAQASGVAKDARETIKAIEQRQLERQP